MNTLKNIWYTFLGLIILLFVAASIATFMLLGLIFIAVLAIMAYGNKIRNRIRRMRMEWQRKKAV